MLELNQQRAVLKRLSYEDRQTLGHFSLFEGVEQIFSAKSLELPWLNNERSISCIPKGVYDVEKRYSKTYGDHFLLRSRGHPHVIGRTWILIHFGNYYQNTKGCILLGRDVFDLNRDGLRDVTSSRETIKTLYKLANPAFELEII